VDVPPSRCAGGSALVGARPASDLVALPEPVAASRRPASLSAAAGLRSLVSPGPASTAGSAHAVTSSATAQTTHLTPTTEVRTRDSLRGA
jgi:hypothetical protein